MNANVSAAIVIAVVAAAAFLVYRQQQADAARFAYEHSLGGSISTTIGGIGNIVGAAVGLAGNGSGSHQ